MLEPALPADEGCRLADLQRLNLLDTPDEERFDRLTRLARRLFDVPIVLISLVDSDRQWFKSCLGLPVRQTPRNISFCGHAILGEAPLLVEDASQDPRFADNPLVTGEPHIRFYAGHPLQISSGSRLGTLCLIDRRPRQLNQEDLALLADLAAMAVRELESLALATVDELTQISNRRGFIQLANKSLQHSYRLGHLACLLFMDLNGFKQINDRFGHAEGDRALKDFAQLMEQEFRQADIFARLGGDEFVVLLPECDRRQAEGVLARFRLALQQFNASANRGYDIRFSTGVVEYRPEQPPELAALLARADEYMYLSKPGQDGHA